MKMLSNILVCDWSAFIFISYMVLFINQGILVTATKTNHNSYNYSTVAVVLLTECLKLFISIVIYAKDKPLTSFLPDIYNNYKVLLLYFVPALLYCVYNNLAFVNLGSYDPTTYYLLLQLRVAITGVIYQLIFKRKLSVTQWISLILLTCGCIIKQMGGFVTDSMGASHSSHTFISINLFLILLQVFCSCFAGVYNEYLLKDAGSKVHIMIQNVFMYIDSIVCNFFALLISGQLTKLSANDTNLITDPKILAVMINNALCGIVTSIFLKNLNSILKTFASALELVFTALLCFMIFGYAIDIYTVFAIIVVSYATYLYSQNPVPVVNNVNNNRVNSDKHDNEPNQVKYTLLSHNDKTDVDIV